MSRPGWLRHAAIALALLGLGAVPAWAKPPVWVVRSPTTTIILFGSIHLLPAGLDWRPDALDQALVRADELWFELPINADSDTKTAEAALRRGVLAQDRRLAGMLTANEQAQLLRAAAAVGLAPASVDRMRPWFADLTLSVAADARGGAGGSDGVERQVQAATPASVARKAFETPDQQIDFLAGASLKDQIASLDFTLREINDDPAAYQRVVGEWMAGDEAALERDAVEPVRQASRGLYERLVTQRNRHWADVLAKRLRKPGHIVVIVGAGHLVGSGGLPSLLRARGFTVDGPIAQPGGGSGPKIAAPPH